METNQNQILNNKQVIAELRKLTKPYVGIMLQGQFSQTCIKIENELCKPATVVAFFAKFGYTGKYENFQKSV